MKSVEIQIIKIGDEEIELTSEIISIYKQNTGRQRATKKSIEKFFNALFLRFNNLL